jgi:hypothetical protein
MIFSVYRMGGNNAEPSKPLLLTNFFMCNRIRDSSGPAVIGSYLEAVVTVPAPQGWKFIISTKYETPNDSPKLISCRSTVAKPRNTYPKYGIALQLDDL